MRSLLPTASASAPSSTPIRKARKRLRGEPVTPSPVRTKRRPVDALNGNGRGFGSTSAGGLGGSMDSDDGGDGEDDESFLGASPVKPSGGKPFQMLFDDHISASTKAESSTQKTKKSIFSTSSKSTLRQDAYRSNSTSTKVIGKQPTDEGLQKMKLKMGHPGMGGVPKGMIANGDNFLEGSSVSGANNTLGPQTTSSQSRKRSRSVEDDESDAAGPKPTEQIGETNFAHEALIPPSPPPIDNSKSGKPGNKYHGKGKGKATAKRARHSQDAVTDDDSMEDDKDFQELDWRASRARKRQNHKANGDADENHALDLDPDFNLLNQSKYHHSDSPPHHFIDSSRDDLSLTDDDNGSFQIDLPSNLQSMLAISPSSRSRTKQEKALAESVLYGRKRGWYDAERGGEIWDVGEDENEGEGVRGGAEEGEDDEWAGEGVPWEAAEL